MQSLAFVPIRGITTIGRSGGGKGRSARITVPKEIMAHLSLKTGDNLSAFVNEEGQIVFEVKR